MLEINTMLSDNPWTDFLPILTVVYDDIDSSICEGF